MKTGSKMLINNAGDGFPVPQSPIPFKKNRVGDPSLTVKYSIFKCIHIKGCKIIIIMV